MICYRDKTFCASPDCKCGRKLTDQIREDARKWWGGEGAPIAVSYFCGGQPNGWPQKERKIEKMDKEYLGDGLYADHDGYQIRLYASNGIETTNEVFLEPRVLDAFNCYQERFKAWKPEDAKGEA